MSSEIDKVNQDIGHRIRAARLNDHQSLEQLSARVGIVPADLEAIEMGTRRASAALLARLAAAMDLEIRAFFDDCCSMQHHTSVALVKQAKSRGLFTNLIEAEKQEKGGLRAA